MATKKKTQEVKDIKLDVKAPLRDVDDPVTDVRPFTAFYGSSTFQITSVNYEVLEDPETGAGIGNWTLDIRLTLANGNSSEDSIFLEIPLEV